MSIRVTSASFAALLGLCGTSNAGCSYEPFVFHPEKNDGAIVKSLVDKGSICRHRFAEGKGYRVTSVDVEGEPQHGVLEKTGENSFVFTPNADFAGKDAYSFKICATKSGKAGCSMIAFVATVRTQSASETKTTFPSECGRGAPDETVSACTRVIDNSEATKADRLRALKWRGAAHFRRGDLDRAIADFSTAIELDPKDSESLNNRGLAFQWRRDFDRAIADYTKSLALNPKLYAAYANRGNVYRLKGDFKNAIADYDRAVALAPRFAGAFKYRAMARQGEKHFTEAFKDLAKAIELAPNDAEAYVARGNLHRLNGDEGRAFNDYERATAINPEYAPAFVNRGAALLARGDYEKAVRDLEKAVRLSPNDVYAIYNRGVAYSQLGEFSRARADFDEASNLTPQGTVYGNRGFALFADGDFAGAVVDFAKLGESQPQNLYAPLWRYLALARSGKDDKKSLTHDTAGADLGVWPGPVISFFRGEISLEALKAQSERADESEKRGRICETAFYLGEAAVLDNRQDDARNFFEQVAGDCPGGTVERVGALGERARLKH
jgi:tetratricopeptide (TPR) repeat protein